MTVVTLYAKKGEEVVCENGHRICTVVQHICVGDLFDGAQLSDWAQAEPVAGTVPQGCAACGAPWWRGGQLHFKDGWR